MLESCQTNPRRQRNPTRHTQRLHPKGMGPNWKVADIIPQPTLLVSGEVRAVLAHLTGAYSLEEE
jgi:hypothetical protein